MKTGRIFVIAVATLGLSGWSFSASADAAAGKATFEKSCAECHEAADFKGEDVKGLTDSIKKIVAGQQKHKSKLTLVGRRHRQCRCVHVDRRIDIASCWIVSQGPPRARGGLLFFWSGRT